MTNKLILNSEISSTDERVHLDPDQRAVLTRELTETISGLSMLLQMNKTEKGIDRGLMRNVLYLSDMRVSDICKLAGIELDSQKEKDERVATIRRVHARNHELERQLGLSGTPEQTSKHMKTLSDKLIQWWNKDGFGHISKFNYTQYGSVEVLMSCNLFGDFPLTNSDKPLTDEERRTQWFESLKTRGFDLVIPPHERDPDLQDSDNNRKLLAQLLTRQFPSSEMVETTNHVRGGIASLRSIRVYIRDLDDIQRLPLAEAKKQP